MKQFLRALWAPALLVLLFVAPLALAATVGARPPTTVWLSAPGWSRARLVGSTALDQPVPIALDTTGGVYLFLTEGPSTAQRPRVVALDRAAAPRWEHSFDVPPGSLGRPQLVWDGRGLALLWLSSARLFLARLDTSGAALAAPAVISGETLVDSYAVAAGERGAVWFAGAAATPGLFASSLADPSRPPVQVAPSGTRPTLRLGADGALHAAWLAPAAAGGLAIAYAAFPDGAPRAGAARELATISDQRQPEGIDGPLLGLSGGFGTLVWTTTATSGMSAGQHFSQYLSFPLTDPGRAAPASPLTMPSGADLRYAPFPAGALAAGPRVAIAPAERATGLPPAGLFVGASGGELALAGELQLQYRYGQFGTQIGSLFFQDGEPNTYQLLTYSPRSALTPALASDGAGALYLTWREIRANGSAVYVASSAPDIVQALSVLTGDDALRMLNDSIFGMVAGVIFSPLTMLLWLTPALLLLIPMWFVRRHDTRFAQWGSLLSVALAVGAYWAAKLTLIRAALASVPFATWAPVIPPWLALPLQIGVPLLIALIGAVPAWQLTYARGRRSAVLLVLIYGAIDALLTMAVYGEALYSS